MAQPAWRRRLRAISRGVAPPAPEVAAAGGLLPGLLAGAAIGGLLGARAAGWRGSKRQRPPDDGSMTAAEAEEEAALLTGLSAASLTVPATASPQEAAAVLEEFGAVIIDRLLPEDTMDTVAAQLEDCQRAEAELRGTELEAVYGRRMGAEILVGAPAVRPLLTQPLVTAAIMELLGRHSKRLALKLLEVIYLPPGGQQQALHREDGLWPSTHTEHDWVCDIMWAVTSFSKENGGTLLIPKCKAAIAFLEGVRKRPCSNHARSHHQLIAGGGSARRSGQRSRSSARWQRVRCCSGPARLCTPAAATRPMPCANPC